MRPLPKKLVTNVVKKPFKYLVHFMDGRQEEYTVEAESKHSAFLMLADKLWESEEAVEKIDFVG